MLTVLASYNFNYTFKIQIKEATKESTKKEIMFSHSSVQRSMFSSNKNYRKHLEEYKDLIFSLLLKLVESVIINIEQQLKQHMCNCNIFFMVHSRRVQYNIVSDADVNIVFEEILLSLNGKRNSAHEQQQKYVHLYSACEQLRATKVSNYYEFSINSVKRSRLDTYSLGERIIIRPFRIVK